MTLLLIRFFSRVLSWLPLAAALAVGRGAGFIMGSVLRIRRPDAYDAMKQSFPEKSDAEIQRILKDMYRNYGMSVVESLRMPHTDIETLKKRMVMVNTHYLDQVLSEGRGFLSVTAHTGHWEGMAALVSAYGYPLAIIVKALKPPALNDWVVASRVRFGTQVLERKGSLRPAMRWLKSNQGVGFMLDQNARKGQGVFVNFFGRPCCTTDGLAKMAIHTGVKVVPAFSFRKPDYTSEVIVGAPLTPPTDPTPENIQAFTQTCSDAVEDFIRAHPEQWIWIHRRWRTQPEPGNGGEGLQQGADPAAQAG